MFSVWDFCGILAEKCAQKTMLNFQILVACIDLYDIDKKTLY